MYNTLMLLTAFTLVCPLQMYGEQENNCFYNTLSHESCSPCNDCVADYSETKNSCCISNNTSLIGGAVLGAGIIGGLIGASASKKGGKSSGGGALASHSRAFTSDDSSNTLTCNLSYGAQFFFGTHARLLFFITTPDGRTIEAPIIDILGPFLDPTTFTSQIVLSDLLFGTYHIGTILQPEGGVFEGDEVEVRIIASRGGNQILLKDGLVASGIEDNVQFMLSFPFSYGPENTPLRPI